MIVLKRKLHAIGFTVGILRGQNDFAGAVDIPKVLRKGRAVRVFAVIPFVIKPAPGLDAF